MRQASGVKSIRLEVSGRKLCSGDRNFRRCAGESDQSRPPFCEQSKSVPSLARFHSEQALNSAPSIPKNGRPLVMRKQVSLGFQSKAVVQVVSESRSKPRQRSIAEIRQGQGRELSSYLVFGRFDFSRLRNSVYGADR
jgi:hypothetical protein